MNKKQVFRWYNNTERCIVFKKFQYRMIGLVNDKVRVFGGMIVKENILINEFYISDCKIVLKSLSEMNEKDADIVCSKLQISHILWSRIVSNSDRVAFFFDEATWLFEFLIEHGYALSDEWFTNGIAIKESEIGK